MPFARYDLVTGEIYAAPLYVIPTNTTQLASIAAKGQGFMTVPEGVSPQNSHIDFDTGKAAPTGPAMIYCYRYSYDPVTGFINSVIHGNILGAAIPDSSAGLLTSAIPLPLEAATILTIDADGMPVKDADGNYTASPPPIVPQPPDLGALLIIGLVKLGGIDPAIIPTPLLAAINASLETVNAPAIAG